LHSAKRVQRTILITMIIARPKDRTMPIQRIGQDFIVNSTTAGAQSNPSITTLADGRFLMTWSSDDAGDGSGACIRGRIYNATGTAAGNDFIVNTTTTNRQTDSSVTVLTDGRFVVTWQSEDPGDGSSHCIRGRIYKADGVAVGNDFIVNTTTTGYQADPAVIELPDGRFVVVWESDEAGDGSGYCVRGRLYGADGNPAGDDFVVDTSPHLDQYDPNVTTLSDGRFVVTWTSEDGGDGAGVTCIRGRIYGSDGVAAGSDFVVNSSSADDQYGREIAALADGRFIVTWASYDPGDGSGPCVRVRIYEADGSPAGNDFILNSTAANTQYAPSVTPLADGRFVAVWQSLDSGDGSGFCIRARLYNIDGSPAGDDFIVNTTTTNNQVVPDVTALPDGRFVVTWYSNDPGDGSGSCIRAQMFDPTKFVGTAGADSWLGGNLADDIRGDAGDDNLRGGGGGDEIYGGTGNDVLEGGAGGDKLVGDAGIDTASYAYSGAGVTVNLASGTGTAGDAEQDKIFEIENVLGSDFADTLVGDVGNNVLDGGAGDDTVIFSENLGKYSLIELHDRVVVSGPDGTDTLKNIEHFKFADGTVHVADDGNPLFDTLYYLSRNPDVFHAGVNAIDHFNNYGWHERRDPNGFFDTSGYFGAHKDVTASGMNPLDHYDQVGWHKGYDPSANFDTTLYLIRNPDVAAAGVDPLAHYLQFGRAEGRQAYQAIGSVVANGFDAEYYLFHNPDVAAAGVDPLAHYQQYGWKEGRDPNGWFDTKGYLAAYQDVDAAGVNPLEHYEQFGWKEGRDPSTGFDASAYLTTYQDVAAAGANPLDHFLQYGIYEGRTPFNDGTWHY